MSYFKSYITTCHSLTKFEREHPGHRRDGAISMINQPVLTKDIPLGGRCLTSTECRRLRKLGVSCSPACMVKPDGSPDYGWLYAPGSNRSWWSFGPRVTTV